jgi:hypothetical protein
MTDVDPLPTELLSVLNGESQDFKVKAQKAYPLGAAVTFIVLGLILTGFMSIFWAGFFGPHAAPAGPPGSLVTLGVICSLFTIVGAGTLLNGLKMLCTPGPWFVGTPTRLIIWSPGSLRTINWEQFNGSLNVDGRSDSGTITVELRTGSMVSQKNGPSRYVPDKIYIVGIPDALAIEDMCRKRINEHNAGG